MRRAVEKHLEDPLAEHLLRGDIKEGDTVNVVAEEKDGKKRLKFSANEGDPKEPTELEVRPPSGS